MTITAGQTILASDFVSTSAGAGDAGKGPKLNANGKLDVSFGKFGGTGADGALAISSGTTIIDLGGASVVTKKYTSISITGTGSLAFTNPHANGTLIILKSQGAVTITSSSASAIDLRSIGSTNSSKAITSIGVATNNGVNAVGGGTRTGGAGGVLVTPVVAAVKNIIVSCGAGGGLGGSSTGSDAGGGGGGGANLTATGTTGATGGASGIGNSNTSAGGRGGGGLYIECAGAYNFTTGTITAVGASGTNGAGQNTGGGGGGAGGSIVVRYITLTANSGTYSVAGGAGGTTADAGGAGGAGGAGYTDVQPNDDFY